MHRREFLWRFLAAAGGALIAGCKPTLPDESTPTPRPEKEKPEAKEGESEKIIIKPDEAYRFPNGNFVISNRMHVHNIRPDEKGIIVNLCAASFAGETPYPYKETHQIDIFVINELMEMARDGTVPEEANNFFWFAEYLDGSGYSYHGVVGLDPDEEDADLFMSTAFSSSLRIVAKIEVDESFGEEEIDRIFSEQLAMNTILSGRRSYADYEQYCARFAEEWEFFVIIEPISEELFSQYKAKAEELGAEELPFRITKVPEVPLIGHTPEPV